MTACPLGARVIIGEERGDIAQLVERTDRTREARGSNPLDSIFRKFYSNRMCDGSVLDVPEWRGARSAPNVRQKEVDWWSQAVLIENVGRKSALKRKLVDLWHVEECLVHSISNIETGNQPGSANRVCIYKVRAPIQASRETKKSL